MNHAIDLPQSLLKRLEKVTEGTRSTPVSIIKDAVKQRVAYEEYKRREIEAGLADIKAGRVYGKDEFQTQLAKARNERKKAA
jgi:predicted transcriptional regulator